MPGLLISGPAGAGKSEVARRALADRLGRGVILDFQSLYAAMLGIERLANGRYPERLQQHEYIMPTVEYVRRAGITAAVNRELDPIVTNSDSRPERRNTLLSLLGPGATEQVVDPGIEIVRARLAGPDGLVSEQCNQAISRWYREDTLIL